MYCPRCGNQIKEGDRFCTQCAFPVSSITENGADDRLKEEYDKLSSVLEQKRIQLQEREKEIAKKDEVLKKQIEAYDKEIQEVLQQADNEFQNKMNNSVADEKPQMDGKHLKFCPNCGFYVGNNKFCGNCGRKIED